MATITLAELATHIGAELHGDGQALVTGIHSTLHASESQVSFLTNKKYRSQLANTKALAVIVAPADLEFVTGNALVMNNPYLGYALAAQLLDPKPKAQPGIHPSAVIHETAVLGEGCHIAAQVVIEAGAILGNQCVIEPGCVIGAGAQLGDGVHLRANVTVYHQVVLGDRVSIQSNTAIGSDGFGFAPHRGQWVKIPQLGRVVVGHDTDIGASVTIDRGALEDTLIGNHVIIDNQVHIAHNCQIGDGTAIAGTTGIAGSTLIGKHCIIGGGVAINGHIQICDGVQITGNTMVVKNITEPGTYSSGMPAMPNREWRRGVHYQQQLGELFKRVKQLETDHSDDNY